ncbi:hypothetical protein [Silvanigrella aquatica]|uniref:Uncharacterized protein n=1 Tax=Silvanigrella aquatica TaxID=1915309 RepID=A0A1L4D3Q0_9BACT|nr:hypothetical protein [Silvanigrella aquatica]APJ04809.1 hypothetical protein AXG55_13240 [Silvanigrella aquatica]
MIKVLLIGASFFVSLNAMATPIVNQPLLSKKQYSGYVAPGYNTSHECNIYPNWVVITYGAGEAKIKHNKRIAISGNIFAMIEEAKRGPYEKNNSPLDASAASYTALKTNIDGTVSSIDLGVYVGDTWQLANLSAGAFGLRHLLDKLCD